jgi:hypothetical protein
MAHLTSVTRINKGYLATCVCGWEHKVTRGDLPPGAALKKQARQVAWNHWASKPVDA